MVTSGDLKLLSVLMMLHRKLCSISEKYHSRVAQHTTVINTAPTGFQSERIFDTVQSKKNLLQVHMTLFWVPVLCSGHMCSTFTGRYCLLLLLHDD